jgi:hypothetical protein
MRRMTARRASRTVERGTDLEPIYEWKVVQSEDRDELPEAIAAAQVDGYRMHSFRVVARPQPPARSGNGHGRGHEAGLVYVALMRRGG